MGRADGLVGWMGWLSLEGAIYRAPTVLINPSIFWQFSVWGFWSQNHCNKSQKAQLLNILQWNQIKRLYFEGNKNNSKRLNCKKNIADDKEQAFKCAIGNLTGVDIVRLAATWIFLVLTRKTAFFLLNSLLLDIFVTENFSVIGPWESSGPEVS